MFNSGVNGVFLFSCIATLTKVNHPGQRKADAFFAKTRKKSATFTLPVFTPLYFFKMGFIMSSRIVLTFIVFLCSPYLMAHQAWTEAEIKSLVLHDDGSENFQGEIHVVMQSSASSRPSCASTSAPDRFTINMSRPLAKSQYSAVLAAYMSKKPLSIVLNDYCDGNVAVLRNIVVGANS